MKKATKRAPRLAAISTAAMAGLLLAGCSTGHIGESWQCPLAEGGGTCDSVAAADPAVPDRMAAGPAVLAEPLWRAHGDERPESPPARQPASDAIPAPGQAAEDGPCAEACGEGFDPFAWLARLFGGGADRAGPGDTTAAAAGPGTVNPSAPGDVAREAEPAASPPAPAGTETGGAAPETAALLRAELGPAQDEPDAGDLRTDEVVARIWIAPFVDAEGVYREAGHVRVVVEPAGWRLP